VEKEVSHQTEAEIQSLVAAAAAAEGAPGTNWIAERQILEEGGEQILPAAAAAAAARSGEMALVACHRHLQILLHWVGKWEAVPPKT